MRRTLFILVTLLAVSSGTSQAKCILETSNSGVEAFKTRPDAYLRNFTDTQRDALWWHLRIFATIKDIGPKGLLLARQYATFDQRYAIGKALASAAGECRITNPDITRNINTLIKTVYDTDILRAYQKGWQPESEGQGLGNLSPDSDRKVAHGAAGSISHLPIDDPFAPQSDPIENSNDPNKPVQ